MTSAAWSPVSKLSVLFLVACAGIYVVTLSTRDYVEHYEAMSHDRVRDQRYYELVCKDPSVKDQTGTAASCEEKMKSLRRDPGIYALYKVIEGWNFCNGGKCIGIVERSADMIVTIFWLAVVAFAVGVGVFGWRFKTEYNHEQNKELLASCHYPSPKKCQ